MCFRKLIFEDFGTHLDQNPVQSTLFRSFWCPTDTFSESFGIFSRCTISTFSFKSSNSHVFEHRIDGGLLFLTFEHFGVQLNSFSDSFGIVSRCTISTFPFQYCLRKKTKKQSKSTFLHLTDPIKTKENLNLFHF